MLQRFFTIIAKGVKGKNRKPFLQLQSDAGEKLILYLESISDLGIFQIDDELAVEVGGVFSKQQKLPGAK